MPHSQTIRKKMENHRKEIRRQYIDTFIKNKRKQLFQQNYRVISNSQQRKEQQGYLNYLSVLSLQTFKQEPNNHLQYLVEILSSENSKSYRSRQSDMLIIVHGYLIERFSEQRSKMEYLRDIIKENKALKIDMSNTLISLDQLSKVKEVNKMKQNDQNNKGMNEDELMTDQVIDILVYNEVFFQPIYASRQQRFALQNEVVGLNKKFQQQAGNSLYQVTSKKVNVYLLLDFLMAIMYQLTPDTFINSVKQKNNNQFKSFNNGYDQLLINQNNNNNIFQNYQQHQSNNIFSNETHNNYYNAEIYSNNQTQISNFNNHQQNQIAQFICILNDIYNMILTLFKITLNFKYQIHPIQKLSHYFHQLYNPSKYSFNKLKMNNSIPPLLWLDKDRMLIKASVKNNISTRCLHVIVNLTALVTMNPQLDKFIHNLMILTQLDYLTQDNGFTQEEITLFINLYSNLVEEEIIQQHQSSKNKYQQQYNENQLISEEQQLDNDHILKQPPGIYINLLRLITQNAQTQEELTNLVFILKVILQNYEIPSRQESIKIQTDNQYLKAQNSQLIMSLYHADQLSQNISSLFFKLAQKQLEIGQLSNLYIQVIEKMMTYLLYLNQLPEILSLVIKNQNKRMFDIQSKCKSSLNSISFQNQQKQKRIITQNLKKVLIKTKQLIENFTDQVLQKSHKNQINLNYSHQTIPKDIIDSILELWQQNEIEYCYDQFLQFIHTAVKYFPQHLILTQSKSRNQHFLDLLDQIPSDSSCLKRTSSFIQILQITVHYIEKFSSTSYQKPKYSVAKFFTNFQDKWLNILQNLEGLLYSQNLYQSYENKMNLIEFSNTNFHLKVQYLYENINSMLKFALENMQIQI